MRKTDGPELKKMVLISIEAFQKLKEASEPDRKSVPKNNDPSSALLSEGTTEEQLQKYHTALRDKAQSESRIAEPIKPTPLAVSTEVQTTAVDVSKPYREELMRVIENLPPSFKSSGMALLKHLHRADPTKLTWTEQGEVIINSKRLMDTNIGEFLEVLSRTKKLSVWPNGLDKFIAVLKEIDTPLSSIVNREIYIAGGDKGSSVKEEKFTHSKTEPSASTQTGHGRWKPYFLSIRRKK